MGSTNQTGILRICTIGKGVRELDSYFFIFLNIRTIKAQNILARNSHQVGPLVEFIYIH